MLLPKVKLKTIVSFPAAVHAGMGINVAQANGVYTLSLGYGGVPIISGYSPLAEPTEYLVSWQQNSNLYSRISVTNFMAQFTGYQPLDPTLTALAALDATPGLLIETAADVFTKRTLQQPAAGITIANPQGVAGDPTFALANDLLALESIAAVSAVPYRTGVDTWATMFSGNLLAFAGLTSLADVIGYFTGSGTPTMATTAFTPLARTLVGGTTQAAMQGTLGLTPGTNVQAFDSDLTALAINAAVGSWTVTGVGTGACRVLTGPAAGITVTNGSGVAGNPTIGLANDLAAVEGLATTGLVRRTVNSPEAWSAGTAVANAELATMNAFTFKGNATAGVAAPTDVDIGALTSKPAPVATDEVLLRDNAAAGAWKRTPVSALASAGSVASIAGNTGAFTLSQGLRNVVNDLQADPGIFMNYIAGLTLSTAGTSSSFQVAAGIATDSTNAVFMKLAAIQKNTGNWSVGNNGGGLVTGALAGSTFYHVWLIRRPDTGVVDVIADAATNATPTLPPNYTQFRRIGSIRTDASNNWTKFIQRGVYYSWDVSFNDVANAVIGTVAIPTATAVPPGVKVKGTYNVTSVAPLGHGLLVSPMDVSDQVVTSGNVNVGFCQATGGVVLTSLEVITDTSRQIRVRASIAGCNYYVWTQGWQDFMRAEGV